MDAANKSSSNPGGSDEETRTTRSQAKIDVLDIPAVGRILPLPVEPSLDWYKQEPPRPIEDLSEAQLKERLKWSVTVSERLDDMLESAKAQLMDEWIAKEELLNEVFAKEIPDAAPVLNQ